jgi:hypothetical protein
MVLKVMRAMKMIRFKKKVKIKRLIRKRKVYIINSLKIGISILTMLKN